MEGRRFSSGQFFSSLTRHLESARRAKSLASHDRLNKSCPVSPLLLEMQLVQIVYSEIPFLDMLSPVVRCYYFRYCNSDYLIKHIIEAATPSDSNGSLSRKHSEWFPITETRKELYGSDVLISRDRLLTMHLSNCSKSPLWLAKQIRRRWRIITEERQDRFSRLDMSKI